MSSILKEQCDSIQFKSFLFQVEDSITIMREELEKNNIINLNLYKKKELQKIVKKFVL